MPSRAKLSTPEAASRRWPYLMLATLRMGLTLYWTLGLCAYAILNIWAWPLAPERFMLLSLLAVMPLAFLWFSPESPVGLWLALGLLGIDVLLGWTPSPDSFHVDVAVPPLVNVFLVVARDLLICGLLVVLVRGMLIRAGKPSVKPPVENSSVDRRSNDSGGDRPS